LNKPRVIRLPPSEIHRQLSAGWDGFVLVPNVPGGSTIASAEKRSRIRHQPTPFRFVVNLVDLTRTSLLTTQDKSTSSPRNIVPVFSVLVPIGTNLSTNTITSRENDPIDQDVI
jgi:hypothetical protein